MIRLRDIMTKDVISVSPDLSIRDAMDLLATRHMSGVPVLAGREVVGVISATDLMSFAAGLPGAPAEREDQVELGDWDSADEDDEDAAPTATFFTELWADSGADVDVRFASVSGPEWNVLDEHTVSEAMTRAPICKLPPDTTVPVAAEFMHHHSVHRVLVTDGPRLLGIVTSMDIAKAVAEHRLTSHTYVFGTDSRFDKRGWERRR